MQTSFLNPLISPLCPFSGDLSTRKIPPNSVFALQRDAYDKNHNNGRLVDENMAVLRKRIQEMKMLEANNEPPPDDWMEWEKAYYAESYNSDISEGIGFLQHLLMETRPSLALGMVALVLFSVPTSMMVVVLQFMDMAAKSVHLT